MSASFPGDLVIEGVFPHTSSAHRAMRMSDEALLVWGADGDFRVLAIDVAAGSGDLPVGARTTVLADGRWTTIDGSHRLDLLGPDRVLDWVPTSRAWRLWRCDPAAPDGDPLPELLASGTFSSIGLGHRLTWLDDDLVLDVKNDGAFRFFARDDTLATGDPLPGPPLVSGRFPGIDGSHRLLRLDAGLVLDWVPNSGVWQILGLDAGAVSGTPRLTPPVAAGTWPGADAERRLMPLRDGHVLDWVPSSGSFRVWRVADKTAPVVTGLRSPRFAADEILEACLRGYRVVEGGGDPPETVIRIQQALADLGFPLAVDGTFGTETGNAVISYKTIKNIVPNDPVVGLETMSALDADFFPYPFEADFQACIDNIHAAIPFGSDDSTVSAEFATMGFDGDPDSTYHPGWELTASTSSTLCNLTAMFAGSVEVAASGALILTVNDAVLSSAVQHEKPAWSVPPTEVVYEGVDLEDLRRTLKDAGGDSTQIDSLVSGTGVIDVLAGTPLVDIAGTGNPGTRHYVVRAVDREGGIESDRNLSTFVEEYSPFFSALATHSLSAQLTSVRAPVSMVREGRKRYVEASSPFAVTLATHGGPLADCITDPKKPARFLKEAVSVAADGDTVLIADRSIYAEGEILINHPLVIASRPAGTPQDDPTDSRFNENRFPKIRPKGTGRVFLIQGTPAQPLSGVRLFGLVIENGVTDTSTPPTEIGGAGIGVIDCDLKVRIDRCLVRGNTTSSAGSLGTVDFLAKLDARIAMMADGPAKTFALAFRVAYALSGIPTVKPNFFIGGQSFGGGICFGWSDGHVYKCKVSNNKCGGRGHGIGVIGYGWPVIDSSLISHNLPNSTGRRDGGGIGIEIAVPDGLTRSMMVSDLMDAFVSFLGSLTTFDVIKLLLKVGLNLAQLATGFTLNAFKDLLPHLSIFFVQTIKNTAWSDDRIMQAHRTAVHIRNTIITNNHAGEGGGGVYASVLSNVALSANVITDNSALAGAGGGVRITFGSRAVFKGNDISRNQSTSVAKLGGGGIALRNVECSFEGSGV